MIGKIGGGSLKKIIEHNQCDLCYKKFKTALGFHQHYPECVSRNYRKKWEIECSKNIYEHNDEIRNFGVCNCGGRDYVK